MMLNVKARAKINWSLCVCGEREDGYHELDMLMQSIELCDDLQFEPARFLTLTVDGQRLPTDSRNLVLRAAHALNDAMGTRKGARIALTKRIPSRAGLGGGSADCAAALVALNRLWGFDLPMRTLQKIGLSLGADVPFCLAGGLCRAQGVGEILTPVENPPVVSLVLVTPGGGLSTPAVFQEWSARELPCGKIDSAVLSDALVCGDWSAAQTLSRNDLEAPAISLMPEIGGWMARFREFGADYVRMSGSGSTVFAAFRDPAAAENAAARIPGAILTKTAAAPDWEA